jgi:hypothetical protein
MKSYKKIYETKEKDLNELIGEFKAKYKSISQLKNDMNFRKLSQADREYVLDELKSDMR